MIVVTTEPTLEEALRASGKAPDGLKVHFRPDAAAAVTLARSLSAAGKSPILALTDESVKELAEQHLRFYFNYAGCLTPKAVSGSDLASQLLADR